MRSLSSRHKPTLALVGKSPSGTGVGMPTGLTLTRPGGKKPPKGKTSLAVPESDTEGATAPPTLTLVVDGARSSLNDVISEGENRYLAVSVARHAKSVEVELAHKDLAQTVDLETGKRTGVSPAILYRPGSAVAVKNGFRYLTAPVNETFSLPFAIAGNFDGDYPTQLTIMSMDLQNWVVNGHKTAVASSPDTALLQIVNESSGGNTWGGPIDPKNVTLVADGKTYTAKTLHGMLDEVNLMASDTYFEVPASITVGTVVIKPGTVHHRQGPL